MTINVSQPSAGRPPLTIAVTDLPQPEFGAVTGIVQRSTDGGIRWVTARGLAEAEIDAGALPVTPDWEFRAGVANRYRAGINEILSTFSDVVAGGWGDTDTGQTWAPDPLFADPGANASTDGSVAQLAHPTAGTSYLMVLDEPDDIADIDVTATFKVNAVPTGGTASFGFMARWTGVGPAGLILITVEIATDGSMTLTAGSLSDTAGQTAISATSTGTETFALRLRARGPRIQVRCWDIAAGPEPTVWHIDIHGTSTPTAGRFGILTARGIGNTNDDLVFTVDDVVLDVGQPQWVGGTASITPSVYGIWLCSVMRSFLNLAPMVVDFDEPSRGGRGDATAVVGRALPIGQSELMSGRAWTLVMRASTLADARRLEYLLSSGDFLWLLTPPDCPIPSGYYLAGSMGSARVNPRGAARLFEVPLIEVAAPGPDIVTAQSTWDTVINTYGDWPAVVAAHPGGWDSVLSLIGDPAEVVVDQ